MIAKKKVGEDKKRVAKKICVESTGNRKKK